MTLSIEIPGHPTFTATRLTGTDDVPRLWEYSGKVYCDNLFRLHDERGIPLVVSVNECKKHGFIPCIDQFRMDAIRAGWSRDKIDREISEAVAP